MKSHYKLIFLLLSALFSIPAIIGILHPGFFVSDDGSWMVIRFSAFYEVLRSGEFPVRFLTRLNNGFGYPVADFLYPLFMYIGVPIHILGVNFVNTIKTILILSVLLSSVFAYLWLKKFFDDLSSMVGAIFYTYFPYHLFDIYKRGSVGEVLSLSIIPFVLWQIERRSIFLTSIGIGFLILAHNTLAILFLPLIIVYALLDIFVDKNQKGLIFFYIEVFLLGMGLSAFFWIPAVFDIQYTVFSKTQVSNWAGYFSGLNLIGLSAVFVILVTFIFIFTKKIKIEKHRLTILFLIVGLISVFFASSYSMFLWNFLPVSFIQFPFRFLSLSIIAFSFLAACIVSVLSGKNKIIIAGIFVILIMFSSKSFLSPTSYQNYPDTYYSTNQDSTTVKNEYMPKWAKDIPQSMVTAKVENLTGEEALNVTKISPNKISFNMYLPLKRTIQVNTIYFPGWLVFVNGHKTDINYNNDKGLIRVNLNKGRNDVLVVFSETPVRIISDFISIISLLILFSLIFLKRKLKFIKI
jgi:hypothetical protein